MEAEERATPRYCALLLAGFNNLSLGMPVFWFRLMLEGLLLEKIAPHTAYATFMSSIPSFSLLLLPFSFSFLPFFSSTLRSLD
jgi:hypothetical protein